MFRVLRFVIFRILNWVSFCFSRGLGLVVLGVRVVDGGFDGIFRIS